MASLQVKKADLDMAGTYTVKLTNMHGSTRSSVDVRVVKGRLSKYLVYVDMFFYAVTSLKSDEN